MKRAFWTAIPVAMIASVGLMGSALAAGDAAAGKAKSATCAGCHGADGEGKAPNPPLAGKKEDEFAQAMKDYKSGKRANPIMKSISAPLNDTDIANLAAYYASLKK